MYKWFIAYLLHVIPNSYYHWIVHDKDPTNLEEAINILFCYGCTLKKDHNKPLASTPNSSQFLGNERHSAKSQPMTLSDQYLLVDIAKKGLHKLGSMSKAPSKGV